MIKPKCTDFRSIEEIVAENSGMNVSELLNDTKEYHINGLNEAAGIIMKGIQEEKIIYIVGDYDVDGVAAAGILDITFLELGGEPVVRLPKRFSEGYGLNEKMVDEFEPDQLMITVDNGISAFEAVRLAKEKGMTVIITDHHAPAREDKTQEVLYPEADLIIDPNAIPNSADFEGYCGAGIAYKLAVCLLGDQHPLIPKLTSLAAIATVADSVPLIHENRRIVKNGLNTMVTKKGTTMGLYALLYALYDDRYVDTDAISFQIAPALNAPGRLFDDGAMKAFRLLTFEGAYRDAAFMAEDLLMDNTERKKISALWTENTKKEIETLGLCEDFPIVVYVPNMPEGIVGIVAGKLAEQTNTPCFLFTDSTMEGVIKASARSGSGVDLKKLLDTNQQFLLKYGGHADAAGLSIKQADLVNFRESLKKALHGKIAQGDDTIYYDIKVFQSQIVQALNTIIKYGPYGKKNPAPIVYIEDLTLIPHGSNYYQLIAGGEGIKLNSADMEAVLYRGAEQYTSLGNPRHISVAGTMSQNFYNKKFRNQLRIQWVAAYKQEPLKNSLALALAKRAQCRYVEG